MTLNNMLRGIGKFLKWSLISIAAFICLLLLINAIDESPSKEAEALKAIPQISEVSNNGFLALIGASHAPPNEEFYNYGLQWVNAYNSAASEDDIAKANIRFKGQSLNLGGDKDKLCRPTKSRCLPLAKERAKLWRKYYADNKLFVDRQRLLTNFSYFEDIYFPPAISSPVLAHGQQFRALILSLIALDAAEGRLETALSTLESVIAFDRRALLGSRSLILSMVTRHRLLQDYALLAEIVSTRTSLVMAQKERLIRMTEPMEIDQVRYVASRMFEGESRMFYRALPAVFNKPNTWRDNMTRPFLKQQATLNLLARDNEAFQSRLQQFSHTEYDSWLTKNQQAVEIENANDIYSLGVLYNISGKLLISSGMVDINDYLISLADLTGITGITRLARLQVKVVTSRSSDSDKIAIIASNKSLFDPYTNQPMSLDSSKRKLYFDLKGKVGSASSSHIEVGI